MLPVAHWLASPYSRLPELCLFLLTVLYVFRPGSRLGGSARRPASTFTSLSAGTSQTRLTVAASNSYFQHGVLSTGEGYRKTQLPENKRTARGLSGSVTAIRGENGVPPASAGYGDAA